LPERSALRPAAGRWPHVARRSRGVRAVPGLATATPGALQRGRLGRHPRAPPGHDVPSGDHGAAPRRPDVVRAALFAPHGGRSWARCAVIGHLAFR